MYISNDLRRREKIVDINSISYYKQNIVTKTIAFSDKILTTQNIKSSLCAIIMEVVQKWILPFAPLEML